MVFVLCRETIDMYHGEKVAFSTIAQLVLANAPLATLDEAIHFCITVGLPVTLAELGVTEVMPEKIRLVAQTATLPGESIHNMPFPVDTTKVADAILTADCLGRNHH